jgi:hypothetical protein
MRREEGNKPRGMYYWGRGERKKTDDRRPGCKYRMRRMNTNWLLAYSSIYTSTLPIHYSEYRGWLSVDKVEI